MKRILTYLAVFTGFIASAQNQFHMGQYMVHQPFLNPASIGSYENFNAALLYKNQWTGFEGAPKIQGLNLNTPLKNGNSYVGLTVIHDEVGVNNATEISGTYAYRVRTGLHGNLVFGLSASLNLLQSDLASLAIQDEQDPIFTSSTPTYALPNFKFGTYYYKKKFYIGFTIPNILENKVIYDNGFDGIADFNIENLHYYLHSGYSWELNANTDLNTSILLKQVNGAPLQIDLNAQVYFNDKFGIGASYRTSKELLGLISYKLIPELQLSYGYEFNFSDIGRYSNGTHEILLIYNYNPPSKPIVAVPRF